MRIVVFFFVIVINLNSIIDNQDRFGYEVCSCFTNNPNAGGIDICKDQALDCKIIDNNRFDDRIEFDKKIDQYLTTIEPDFIILAGYMRIWSSARCATTFERPVAFADRLLAASSLRPLAINASKFSAGAKRWTRASPCAENSTSRSVGSAGVGGIGGASTAQCGRL